MKWYLSPNNVLVNLTLCTTIRLITDKEEGKECHQIIAFYRNGSTELAQFKDHEHATEFLLDLLPELND